MACCPVTFTHVLHCHVHGPVDIYTSKKFLKMFFFNSRNPSSSHNLPNFMSNPCSFSTLHLPTTGHILPWALPIIQGVSVLTHLSAMIQLFQDLSHCVSVARPTHATNPDLRKAGNKEHLPLYAKHLRQVWHTNYNNQELTQQKSSRLHYEERL